MTITTITSRDNSLLKLARSTRDGDEPDLIFVEGLRLCEEALRSGLELEAVIFSDEIAEKDRAADFIHQSEVAARRIASVNEKLLAAISYTKTPQGIIALARRPASGPHLLEKETSATPLLVVLHGINNPVNVGAILRSAEAAGATGVIATAHTTDPFSPKSLRGAMGSAFRLPIWIGPKYAEALAWCGEHKIQTVSADANATSTYIELDWTQARALIVGPEAAGLSSAEIAATDVSLRIPMHGEVESLNAGVAAAIILYEAARQRNAFGVR